MTDPAKTIQTRKVLASEVPRNGRIIIGGEVWTFTGRKGPHVWFRTGEAEPIELDPDTMVEMIDPQ